MVLLKDNRPTKVPEALVRLPALSSGKNYPKI